MVLTMEPAFVYREGDVEEVILPNKLPVGQGKRLPVYRGRSLEITGTATYGVAMEKDRAIEDLTLPVGYDVDLLTAELVTLRMSCTCLPGPTIPKARRGHV